MNQPETIAVLNRLHVLHGRSLPVYLADARPWTHRGNETAAETLAHVVADQKNMAERIGSLIIELGGAVDRGRFPMRFTDLHDLSLDYLLDQIVEHQRRIVAQIERGVERLARHPQARSLAEEALGMARGHLESLDELMKEPSGT
jgi:predicted outer membrane protein